MSKILAMLALLLAITPLSSLYGIFWSIYEISELINNDNNKNIILNDNPEQNTKRQRTTSQKNKLLHITAFAKSFHHNDKGVDELIHSIFLENENSDGLALIQFPGVYTTIYSSGSAAMVKVQLITLILPWMLSLLIGVIVPLIHLYVYQRRRGAIRNNRENPYNGADYYYYPGRLMTKKEKISKMLASYTKRLSKKDVMIDLSEDENINEDTIGKKNKDQVYQTVILPNAGTAYTSLNCNQNTLSREVSGSCAICLMQYEISDLVCWSSNKECQHAFHATCLTNWLCRKKHFLCPCCRQEFITKEQPSKFVNKHI